VCCKNSCCTAPRLHHVTLHQVEKISPRPHGSWHYAILRVICPCDLLESVESSKRTGCSQPGVVKNFVRARDCSSSVCHARHALLNALRCSVSVQTSRPSCCLRSLGCSVMNEQLMALCNISVRLKSAANRARQVFGHVPVLSLDPLSAVWQLLSLCCVSQQERAASLAPSASVFSLLELLRLRLDSTKLFCRYCGLRNDCQSQLLLCSNISPKRYFLLAGLVTHMFVIMRISVQFRLLVQFPRL
jgi:hypothetical protein